jgi:hypothetical protein
MECSHPADVHGTILNYCDLQNMEIPWPNHSFVLITSLTFRILFILKNNYFAIIRMEILSTCVSQDFQLQAAEPNSDWFGILLTGLRRTFGVGGLAHLVEGLSSNHEALNSNLSTVKKKKRTFN